MVVVLIDATMTVVLIVTTRAVMATAVARRIAKMIGVTVFQPNFEAVEATTIEIKVRSC
jgi:hypothetical protein